MEDFNVWGPQITSKTSMYLLSKYFPTLRLNGICFRYGNGYSVSLFFTEASDVTRGLDFVHSRFPYCTNLQCHNATIQFRVANEPPSVIFGHVLANKDDLGIQDFAVKHTTLDEVFVNFASNNTLTNVMEMRRPPSGESSSMSIHLETEADGSYNSDEEQISHV